MAKKRYAIVGTGGRSRMFSHGIYKNEQFAEHAELVALCDLSPQRMKFWNENLQKEFGLDPLPCYTHDRFDDMVKENDVDVVIVTTMDSTHHTYIIRAMELGCDVVSEKPMTTDEEKAQAILDTCERTGQKLRVTFNYRYMPAFTMLREIVASGKIGKPMAVHFNWYLDTSHGADYFRRWHREKSCSGGLLVHKSTHHFDLVNFWLNDFPKTVFAMGDTKFYGKENAAARGESYSYDRYTGEEAAKDDPFRISLVDEDTKMGGWKKDPSTMQQLYYDAEADSGYVRDRNVFSDAWPLDAEDVMAVVAQYHGGPILNYSLIAFNPWEGERVCIIGDKGFVEYFARGKGHIIAGQSDEDLAAAQFQGEKYLRYQPMFGQLEELEIPKATGGHGGGDIRILERIFLPEDQHEPDPLNRDADHIDGARSILTGVAANKSIATGQAIEVDQMIKWPESAVGRIPAAV